MESVILIKNVSKEYEKNGAIITALENVNITIKKGECVAIVGKSGSGKSTLMNIIGLLDTQTRGEYFFCGENIFGKGDSELAAIRNKKIGFIFQDFNLIANLNAIENVCLPLVYQGISHKEQKKIGRECLEKVGLSERMMHYPKEMSGGQQQRTAIARVIATNPEIILADEPTGNLDEENREQVIKLLIEENKRGKTVVIITHDEKIANLADRKIEIH
ncbi:MAG: ABC transporter ATP-binding protein, partial [Oscillospiraceae bacterium]